MKKIEIVIVVFVLALITLVNIYWIYSNSVPPGWDDSSYLEASERIYQSAGLGEVLKTSVEVLQRRAPLIAYVTLPIYIAFGSSSPKVALVENLVWLGLFLTFFYLLIKDKFNQKIAFMSMLITVTMPLFYGLVRHFYVEFGLMTLIVIWIYILFKTESLSNTKYLLMLGFITGLGLLMKITFPVYISGFLLLETYKFLKRKPKKSKITKNLIIFSVPTLVAAPWYLYNLRTVLFHAKRSFDPAILQQYYYGNPYSPKAIYLTLLDIINFVTSTYYFFLAVILFIFLLQKRKIVVNKYLLVSLAPILMTILSSNKDYRLFLPIVPIFGLAIAWLIWRNLKERSTPFLFLALLFPILLFINTSVSPPLLSKRIMFGSILIFDNKIGDYVYPPDNTYWPIKETLLFIANIAPSGKTRIVLTTSEAKGFNINNLKYYALKKRINLEFKSIAYSGISDSQISEAVRTSDFILELESVNHNFQEVNLQKYKEIKPKIHWTKVDNNLTFPEKYKLIIFKNPQL